MHIGALTVYLLYGIVLVHCRTEYHYVNLQLTWEGARQYCREHYTDLATLENEEDVRGLNIPTWAWIGLFDDPASWRGAMTSDSNSWRWSASGTTSPGGYQNWASSDPNNAGGNQYCVYFQNGLWFDHSCATSLHFVCYTVQPSGTKDYILITTAKTWTSSQAYCRQHYHDLATIATAAENQAVRNVLPSTTYSVWIGLFRSPWRWSNGSASTYRTWKTGEPNNLRGYEFCGLQLADHTWNDARCDTEGHFVCQKIIKTSSSTTKIRVQSTANLSDPAVGNKLLKVLESRLGAGFCLSWFIPPTKEEKKKLNEYVCP